MDLPQCHTDVLLNSTVIEQNWKYVLPEQNKNVITNLALPPILTSGNNLEFTAKAIRKWACRIGVRTSFVEPGNPQEDGYIESLNGKLRDELLNREMFVTLGAVKTLYKQWR